MARLSLIDPPASLTEGLMLPVRPADAWKAIGCASIGHVVGNDRSSTAAGTAFRKRASQS
jgi:hypothetical protein